MTHQNHTTPHEQCGICQQDERIRQNMTELDWEHATLDELEEVFEDRDPTEFL